MNTITQINDANYSYYVKNSSKGKQSTCMLANIGMHPSFKAKCSAKPFKSWVEYIKSLWEGFPATTQIIENKNLKKAMKINPDKTRELYRDNIGYIKGTYTPTMIWYIIRKDLDYPMLGKLLKSYFRQETNGYVKPDEVDKLVLKFIHDFYKF